MKFLPSEDHACATGDCNHDCTHDCIMNVLELCDSYAIENEMLIGKVDNYKLMNNKLLEELKSRTLVARHLNKVRTGESLPSLDQWYRDHNPWLYEDEEKRVNDRKQKQIDRIISGMNTVLHSGGC